MIKFYFIFIFQSILEDKDVNSTLDWLEMIEKSVVYITVEKLQFLEPIWKMIFTVIEVLKIKEFV